MESGVKLIRLRRRQKIAGKIKSFLHFSRPDEGPLTDYETWMPDFIGGLARTLRGNRGILAKAVTDVSSALNIRPTIRTSVNSMGSNKAGNVINQKVEINNTVQTTDTKAGKAAAKQMEKSGDDVTNQITKGLADGDLTGGHNDGKKKKSKASGIVRRHSV